ncbi:hypothetical protein ACPX19_01380 [Winogradskyella sp. HB-48]|uniref:hypothetical protein n=1 Tax=Winogradskyella sp. HB-48 TaxID=3416808 RepID=UPI003CEB370E
MVSLSEKFIDDNIENDCIEIKLRLQDNTISIEVSVLLKNFELNRKIDKYHNGDAKKESANPLKN